METVKMKRISYSVADVGLLNDLARYLYEQASAMPSGDHVAEAMREGIRAKTAIMQRILNDGGVIENE
jgi:hypothetical protein